MKFFISSVISGFESYREAATRAVRALDHEVIKAEDFSSNPDSPRVACLKGVRESDAVILLLGERYGYIQASGKSAVHEEFEESKSKNLFLFVQANTEFESEQTKLVEEAGDWAKGTYSAEFLTPESLQDEITRAIHRWEKDNEVSDVDVESLTLKAQSNLIEEGDRSYPTAALAVSLVGAPTKNVIRPSVIDSDEFKAEIQKIALFGSPAIFSTKKGIEISVKSHSVLFKQEEESAVEIWEDGAISLRLPLEVHGTFGSQIIGSNVKGEMLVAFQFFNQILDKIDSTQSLSTIVIVAKIMNSESATWSDVETTTSQSTISIAIGREISAVTLSPPNFLRAALINEYQKICEDLVALLRRGIMRS